MGTRFLIILFLLFSAACTRNEVAIFTKGNGIDLIKEENNWTIVSTWKFENATNPFIEHKPHKLYYNLNNLKLIYTAQDPFSSIANHGLVQNDFFGNFRISTQDLPQPGLIPNLGANQFFFFSTDSVLHYYDANETNVNAAFKKYPNTVIPTSADYYNLTDVTCSYQLKQSIGYINGSNKHYQANIIDFKTNLLNKYLLWPYGGSRVNTIILDDEYNTAHTGEIRGYFFTDQDSSSGSLKEYIIVNLLHPSNTAIGDTKLAQKVAEIQYKGPSQPLSFIRQMQVIQIKSLIYLFVQKDVGSPAQQAVDVYSFNTANNTILKLYDNYIISPELPVKNIELCFAKNLNSIAAVIGNKLYNYSLSGNTFSNITPNFKSPSTTQYFLGGLCSNDIALFVGIGANNNSGVNIVSYQ